MARKRSLTKIRAEAELRRHRVLQMILAGATQAQISASESVSRSTVTLDLSRVLSDMARLHDGKANEVRGLQMERLNALLMRQWPRAMQGDGPATDRVLKIMDRITQIQGIIPDKPLISVTQQNLQVNQPFTFTISESNLDDGDKDIHKASALSQAT